MDLLSFANVKMTARNYTSMQKCQFEIQQQGKLSILKIDKNGILSVDAVSERTLLVLNVFQHNDIFENLFWKLLNLARI